MMNVIHYRHKKRLGWPTCNVALDPKMLDVDSPEQTTVLTFAHSRIGAHELTALERVNQHFKGDVVCSQWDYSPLTALLLWDVAHSINAGTKLYLHASETAAELLGRDYYREYFQEMAPTANGIRVFLKLQTLLIEADRGLSGWSFCIPTGGQNSQLLNQCVERILTLAIPDCEILLCGAPPTGFRYFSQVRMIGEDLPDTPVHITRKKNLMAEAAHYPNLCMLHERVLLPHDFLLAVTRFGDDFPFTAFQSFWFADTWRAVPRRYSDFGFAQFVPPVMRSNERPGREILAEFERMQFAAQHPERTNFGREYLTGSLYLCKRSLWRYLPQNEAFYWTEYEDVEHGIRSALAGIPSRINPYAFTESLSYRSVMHTYGLLTGSNCHGELVQERAPMEFWGFRRGPALTITTQQALERLTSFSRRYIGDEELVQNMRGKKLRGYRRYILICRLLWRVHGDMRTFMRDWYQWILCEPEIPIEREGLQGGLDSMQTNRDKKMFLLRHLTLSRQLCNNFFSVPFIDEIEVRHVARRAYIGALLSALWLQKFSRHAAFRLTVKELWRMIVSMRREKAL